MNLAERYAVDVLSSFTLSKKLWPQPARKWPPDIDMAKIVSRNAAELAKAKEYLGEKYILAQPVRRITQPETKSVQIKYKKPRIKDRDIRNTLQVLRGFFFK